MIEQYISYIKSTAADNIVREPNLNITRACGTCPFFVRSEVKGTPGNCKVFSDKRVMYAPGCEFGAKSNSDLGEALVETKFLYGKRAMWQKTRINGNL